MIKINAESKKLVKCMKEKMNPEQTYSLTESRNKERTYNRTVAWNFCRRKGIKNVARN